MRDTSCLFIFGLSVPFHNLLVNKRNTAKEHFTKLLVKYIIGASHAFSTYYTVSSLMEHLGNDARNKNSTRAREIQEAHQHFT